MRHAPKALGKTIPKVATQARKQRVSGGFRVNPATEKLCDDIIKYLSPTLEQHKGCTIADFHPGPCLFSTKLHDYLKPKAHFLIEPEEKYLPFIQPLLDKPGSVYRHSTLDSQEHPALRWSHHLRTRVDPALLPEKKALPSNDPRLHQFDPSFLVIGNLARRTRHALSRPGAQSRQSLDISNVVMYSLSNEHLARRGLFENGLPRMLWWIPEQYKPGVLPANVPMNRNPINVAMDMAFDVTEVAGVTSLEWQLRGRGTERIQRKRLLALDEQNVDAVKERMRESGMVLPRGREKQDVLVGMDDAEEDAKSTCPIPSRTKSVAQLRRDIQSFTERLGEIEYAEQSSDKDSMHELLDTVLYPQCLAEALTVKFGNSKEIPAKLRAAFDLGLRLVNMEASFKKIEEKGRYKAEIMEDLRAEILKVDADFNEYMATTPPHIHLTFERLLDDQIAFYSTPQLLTRDRRAYEPLQVSPTEFHPAADVTLLDMMPKGTNLSVPDLADNVESSKICAQLLKSLFATKSQPLHVSLDRVGVNASKDLIPMVPAITDVRKGGRLNAANMKTRMLTLQMIEGLVKAFFEWPFRPQSWQLMLDNEKVEAGTSEPAKSEPQEIEDSD